jgi:hypothetical protein
MSKTKKIAAAVVMIGSMISIQAMAQSATPMTSTTGTDNASAMGSGATMPSKHVRRQQKAARNKAKRMSAPATTGVGRSPNVPAAGTPAAASGAGS